MMSDKSRLTYIGIVHSCFKEKFGIPRQPGIVKTPGASIELFPPFDREEALKGLEQYSHIWVLFIFHQNLKKGWKPSVRVPRFGGNQKTGVFATRSPFRPNHIGMSAVKYNGYVKQKGKIFLNIDFVDILDSTPVIDIKPYLPYSDNQKNAISTQCYKPPEKKFEVKFSDSARKECEAIQQIKGLKIREFVSELLSYDPRPAYISKSAVDDSERVYGTKIMDCDLKWQIKDDVVNVISVEDVEKAGIR